MNTKIDAQIGRRMERFILRAFADHGSMASWEVPSDDFAELFSFEFESGHVEKRLEPLVRGLEDEGLLSLDHEAEAIDETYRGLNIKGGLTIKGWERLDQLDHPIGAWWYRHWLSAIVASAAVLSSVTATVTLIIALVSS